MSFSEFENAYSSLVLTLDMMKTCSKHFKSSSSSLYEEDPTRVQAARDISNAKSLLDRAIADLDRGLQNI